MAAYNNPYGSGYEPVPEDPQNAYYQQLMNPTASGYSSSAYDPNFQPYQFTQFGGAQPGYLPSGVDPYAVSNGIAGAPGFTTGSNLGGGGTPTMLNTSDPNTTFNNANRTTTAPNTTTAPTAAPAPSSSPSPSPSYPTGGANSLPFGSENIGGVGMYTGANAPLDTSRFNTNPELDFVRSIDQTNYYNYVLPFQQRGGDITNQAAVRKAIEDGMKARGGGTYAVGSQTFNVQGAQPTPNPPTQPVQYSGPQPPLPQQPQPFYNPAMPSAQPSFNPAMAYQLPQVDPSQGRPQFQNPFGLPQNPFMTMQNPGQQPGMMTDMQYQGQRPGIGSTQPSGGYWSGNMNGQPAMNQMGDLQQMIAMAMAQGTLKQQGGAFSGQQQPYGNYSAGQNLQQPYYGFSAQQQPQQPQQQPQYGYNDLTDYGRQQMGWPTQSQSQTAPNFQAATFGGSQAPQQSQSYSQQFSTPQASTSSASNPWGNVSNRQPSYSNSSSYLWGR